MFRLLVCSLLVGCNFDTPFTPEFDRGPDVHTVYEYVDHQWQMDTLCGMSKKGGIVLGCARIPYSTDGVCVITLFKNGLADIKKHEEQHCRYGRWHL